MVILTNVSSLRAREVCVLPINLFDLTTWCLLFQVVVNQGQMGQPYYGHQQLQPPPLPAHSHHSSKSGLMHNPHPHPGGHYQGGGPVESGASSPNAKVRRSGMPLNSDCHLVNTNETLLVSGPSGMQIW